jgi:hypothetical protein
MQRNGVTPGQNAAPFFSSSLSNNTYTTAQKAAAPPFETREGREGTRNKLHKDRERSRDRRPSFGRKSSFGSPSKRRASSSAGNAGDGGRSAAASLVVTDSTAPPALPDFAVQLAAAAKLSRETEALQSPASGDSFSKMLSRTAPTPVNGYSQLAPPAAVVGGQMVGGLSQPAELSMVHQHIQDTANKRISTLDYLRKA